MVMGMVRVGCTYQSGDSGSDEEGTSGANTEESTEEEGHNEGSQDRGKHLLQDLGSCHTKATTRGKKLNTD